MHRTTRIKVFFLPKWRYATCTRKGGAWASHRSHMAGIKGVWTILGSVGEPGRTQRLVTKHEEVRRHEGEEFVRHVAHRSVADRSDRAIGVELERAAHAPTHGGQPVHRAVRSFDEVPMESRVRGFHERIADDLWCLNDPRQGVISKGEPEAESRDRMESNAREPV